MAKPGPKKKPYLQAVREGNPGKRELTPGAVVTPGGLVEPDWRETFPNVPVPPVPRKPVRKEDPIEQMEAITEYNRKVFLRTEAQNRVAENKRARAIAEKEWRHVAPVLIRSVGLADIDQTVMSDYCICVARIDMCERGLSRMGLLVPGQRGAVKNGLTTIVGQYRAQLKTYIGELGLSPSSRTSIGPKPDGDGDGDPFD